LKWSVVLQSMVYHYGRLATILEGKNNVVLEQFSNDCRK